MTHDTKQAALLARILIAKHGIGAAQVAAERVLQWARIGDEETAQLWVEVVRSAATQLVPDGAPSREPELAELIEGQVTTAMMEADGLGRDELEGLLGEIKRKLSS